MNSDIVDYIIVGGGIAGAVLCLKLFEQGNSIAWYDKPRPMSASNVAAGIMNPVTGQRFVKSWMFDELIDAASEFYTIYDQKWNTRYFKHTKIQRALFKRNELFNFELREGDEHYSKYFIQDKSIIKSSFREVEDWCTIQGARLDISGFIKGSKSYLKEKGIQVIEEEFDYSRLDISTDLVRYHATKAQKLVFCEGIGIRNNPFFKYLPMVPAKGECLLVEIPSLDTEDIYKHKVFFVPVNSQNLFWVGSNYDWDFESDAPTKEGYDWLLSKVKDSIQVPFNVKQHIAAIRPTGKDRRPYLGAHSEHNNVFVFNALGTKGSSLAPYWAQQLIDQMEKEVLLPKEVSIKRFDKVS